MSVTRECGRTVEVISNEPAQGTNIPTSKSVASLNGINSFSKEIAHLRYRWSVSFIGRRGRQDHWGRFDQQLQLLNSQAGGRT